MLINSSHIRTYCKLRYNVTDINLYIEDAEDVLKKKINSDLFNRFVEVAAYSAWSNATAYTVGQYVTNDGDLWKCLVGNTNSEPVDGNSNWEVKEVYEGFVLFQKAEAYLAYSKMLIEHGIEVQGDGLVKYSGAESQTAISSSERAALVNKYQNKSDATFNEFLKWIKDASYIIDDVTYLFSDVITHNSNFGIF